MIPPDIIVLYISRDECQDIYSALSHCHPGSVNPNLAHYAGAKCGHTTKFTQELNTRLEQERIWEGGSTTDINPAAEFFVENLGQKAGGAATDMAQSTESFQRDLPEIHRLIQRMGQSPQALQVRLRDIYVLSFKDGFHRKVLLEEVKALARSWVPSVDLETGRVLGPEESYARTWCIPLKTRCMDFGLIFSQEEDLVRATFVAHYGKTE